jgi:hypothetical protein
LLSRPFFWQAAQHYGTGALIGLGHKTLLVVLMVGAAHPLSIATGGAARLAPGAMARN